MDWFRLYDEIIDDPKIVSLPSKTCWHYVQLLCVASRQNVRGSLPNVEHIAIHLRVKPCVAKAVLEELTLAGLIDVNPDTKAMSVHGWDARQRKSDDVAARVKKHRETDKKRYNDEGCNVTETFLAHARQKQIQRQIQNTPLPPKGGVVEEASPKPEPTPIPAAPATPPGVAVPGSAAWKAVLDSTPEAWGPQGEAACIRLLSVFPPAVVAFGMEKVQDRFDGAFPSGAAGWWRTVCHNNPDGRPKAKPSRSAGSAIVFTMPRAEDVYHPLELARMREAGRA